MNTKAIVAGILGLTLGVLVVPRLADAYRGDPNAKGPYYSEERHEAMTKAFENKDYNAWKEQMAGRGRASQVINEQNFARFSEAHKLALEGKMDEAKAIRAELGLGLQNGSGKGNGMGYGRNSR